jgi:uncharacterized protein YlxW (UPF0749 family)
VNKTRFLSIAVVSVVLGLMLAIQFRSTVASQNKNAGVPFDRAQELSVEMRQLEKERDALQQEAEDLTNKLNQANKGQAQALQAISSELNKVKMMAGMLPVKGTGVEIVLDNGKAGAQSPAENLFAVRDDDILKVLNELRGAGAEAISINGVRVIATSEIRLAGTFINVNLTRVLPPYRIEAIGDKDILSSSLEISGGVVEYLRSMGIKVSLEKKEQINIPAYAGRNRFDYAKPI